jgi:hypothetical protein
MATILFVCAGVFVIVIVLIIVFYISSSQAVKSTERKTIGWLKKLSLDELERKVYRYDSEYFRFISEENESVLEFRNIIENRDISTLYKKWDSSFLESFLALERKAGHNGRPMLMDYYYGYELEIKELHDRKRAGL